MDILHHNELLTNITIIIIDNGIVSPLLSRAQRRWSCVGVVHPHRQVRACEAGRTASCVRRRAATRIRRVRARPLAGLLARAVSCMALHDIVWAYFSPVVSKLNPSRQGKTSESGERVGGYYQILLLSVCVREVSGGPGVNMQQ